MRFSYRILILLAAASSVFAAKKIVSPTVTGGNDQIDVVATLYLTESEVTQKLGMDPGPDVALVTVRVTPRSEKAVQVGPDDFILLAHDDGQRNKPFDPAEIAGKGAMIEQTGPPQKGPKTSITGMLGGLGGGSSSPGNTHKVPVTGTKMDDKATGNAKLLQQLKSKQFPEKDTADPVEGFLYFPLDGKHKLKNMALLYRGPAGKLNLEFEH